jgi:hypothetical protein
MDNRFVIAYARKCQFGFAGRNRPLQLLSVLEVAVGLTRRNGTVLCQSLDRIGKLIDLPKQDPRAIEALGLLSNFKRPVLGRDYALVSQL